MLTDGVQEEGLGGLPQRHEAREGIASLFKKDDHHHEA